jgi:MSHA pilin protein MshA
MKRLNEKGFTLIELVLVIVVLGVLAAVATIQFGTLVSDANNAALDGAPGVYNAQLALAINKLKTLPTCAQYDAEVFQIAQPSGGKVTHTLGACASGERTITMTINAGTCEDVWTYGDSTATVPGSFRRTSTARGGC